MEKTNLYMDIHVLQTVPPSCVNRDDTGSPKTAVYGGVTRSRVSSQAWKHSMRQNFSFLFDKEKIGMRTMHVPAELAKEIIALNPELEGKADKLAAEALNLAGIGTKQETKDSEVVARALFFASRAQLKGLAQLVVDDENNKTDKADKKDKKGKKDKDDKEKAKRYKEALSSNPTMDIVLFGRMVAPSDDKGSKKKKLNLNIDAAAQVAHAISTHAVHNEYDYFTAVDDCQLEETPGAAHIGTVEFNSSTLYRYATVNILELRKTLCSNENAVEAALGFAEAFIYSMPDGKQNSFANRTLPDMVYITIRRDMPVNLCGAFEKPIPSSANGYAAASEEALIQYAKQEYSTFIDKPEQALGMGSVENLNQIAEVLPRAMLMEKLEQEISSILMGENA